MPRCRTRFCFPVKRCNKKRWKRLDLRPWSGWFRCRPRARVTLFPSAIRDSIPAAETAPDSINNRSRRMPRFRHVSRPSTLPVRRWWKHEAIRAFEWFLGRNDVGAALYDSLTGGCCDGLSTEGPSANQGSESTLVFLLSLTELRLLEYIIPAGREKTGGNGQTPVSKSRKITQQLSKVSS